MEKIRTDFVTALKRGRGSVFLILEQNPNINFDDLIIKSCLKNYSYDSQAEGIRGSYLFELIKKLKDRQNIEQKVIEKLKKYDKCDWLMVQLFELIKIFAENGNVDAKKMLYFKTENTLKRKKFWSMNVILSLYLIDLDKERGLIFVVENYGKFLSKYLDYDFLDDFFSEIIPDGIKMLKKLAKKNNNIKKFLEIVEEQEKRYLENKNKAISFENNVDCFMYLIDNKRIPVSLRNKLNKEELKVISEKFIQETSEEKKKFFLIFFGAVKFEGKIEYLLKLLGNEYLQKYVISALRFFNDERVRKLFENNMKSGLYQSESIELLQSNYKQGDNVLLKKIYNSVKNDLKHKIGYAILDIYEHNSDNECKSLIKKIYFDTKCSNCRYKSVLILRNIGALKDDILEEMKYDCNEKTRFLYNNIKNNEKSNIIDGGI